MENKKTQFSLSAASSSLESYTKGPEDNNDSQQKKCGLKMVDFKFSQKTSYSDFFLQMKNYPTKLSVVGLKTIYKFLDSKTLGYFSSTRWTNFNNLFLRPFTVCDKNNDCILDEIELKSCLDSEDSKVVLDTVPDGFTKETAVKDIVFSLDYTNSGGLTFDSYLLLKRIIIGFRQFSSSGSLTKETFFSALRVSFADKFIDDIDSEVAFRVAINLMSNSVVNHQLNFMQYLEICRIVSSYLSYGSTIGEGFITKEQVIGSSVGDKLPGKMSVSFSQQYFDLLQEDVELQAKNTNNLDPFSMRFEDYSSLEFWANIFSNYTDTKSNYEWLNVTGFRELVLTNRYIEKRFLVYIAYSNFENYTNITNSTNVGSDKVSDLDFLTNFNMNFLETLSKKKANSLKTSVFDRLNLQTNSRTESRATFKSLFQIELDSSSDEKVVNPESENKQPTKNSNLEENVIPLAKTALEYYFSIIDMDYNGYLTFDEFITFIKYLKIYQKLDKNSQNPRGLIPSISVNCIIKF